MVTISTDWSLHLNTNLFLYIPTLQCGDIGGGKYQSESISIQYQGKEGDRYGVDLDIPTP